jgi:predicted Zn-dependent peptidase
VVEITERIVAELVADGITERERELALGFLEGSLELAQEDTGSRMARIGRGEQARSELLTLDEHLAKLRAVTTDDVAGVLCNVLDGPRTLVAVGPFDDLPT